MTHKALIVVDVQNDFCEGGSLAVAGGAEVAARIATFVQEHGEQYDTIVATADSHVDPGDHFSDTPDFVDSWPRHCEWGTQGAEFHPNVMPAMDSVEAVFHKGQNKAAYSGFDGFAYDPATVFPGIGLNAWLHRRGITAVDVVGIATDYCVKATALDAAKSGYRTTVILSLTAAVSAEGAKAAVDEMRGVGIACYQLYGARFYEPAS